MSATTQGEQEQREETCFAFALSAGSTGQLDGVLEHAVVPAVERAAPDHWSFVRWFDDGGPHVHVSFTGARAGAEDLVAMLRRGAEHARDLPERESLLALPASRHGGTEGGGVRRLDEPMAGEPRAALAQISSELAVGALPTLADPRDRCALALSLMQAVAADAGAFWEKVAQGWIGDAGDAVREYVAIQVGELGADLRERAARLQDGGGAQAGVERWVEQIAGLEDPEDVRRQVHLMNNRLGLTPIEEALLAGILAAHDDAGEAAVQLDQITKTGGDDPLSDRTSLTVARGETLAILGPDGAGKATLLGIAAGLRVADGGSVRVLGFDPSTERDRLADDVVLALPEGELAGELTVRENLDLHLRANGTGGGGQLDKVLEETGLREHAGAIVADLAPGHSRLVSIACALLGDPEVLLLAEPAADLAPIEREEVWRIVTRRAERGATTILSTTSLQDAVSVCDRAALVVDGRLVGVGTPMELAEEHFPERSLHFQVAEEPDLALVDDLPEVSGVRADQRPDHWAIEVRTRQPDELLKLLGADPDFPAIHSVSAEDLADTFTYPGEPGAGG